MRIDKFIGNNTLLSRTQIHIAIKKGIVKSNGDAVHKTNTQMTASDVITLNDDVITARQPRYIMLHKPKGYVCANSDSEHPTVLDLFTDTHKKELQIAGRLDIDTTGLVLLTDDGEWNHRVTSPKHEHTKSYLVTTADPINDTIPALFAQGILLESEKKPTRPAQLTLLSSHTARLDIHEGKYHQVKRMFAAVGNRVVGLHRESIEGIKLDNNLKVGEYRMLTAAEISTIN
jgi:16S rRNA pseudouridine516 synthase